MKNSVTTGMTVASAISPPLLRPSLPLPPLLFSDVGLSPWVCVVDGKKVSAVLDVPWVLTTEFWIVSVMLLTLVGVNPAVVAPDAGVAIGPWLCQYPKTNERGFGKIYHLLQKFS